MDNEIVLQMDPSSENSRNSEGAFVTLRDGRIAFAWSKYVTEKSGDHARAVIACIFSDDEGQTWGNEKILAEPAPGEANVMSVSLLRLQDGRILFAHLRKVDHGNGTYDCRPVVRFSDDDMETFSAPQLVTAAPGYYVLNNDRVIQLKSGRLLMPLALHRFRLPPLTVQDGTVALTMARSAQIVFLHSDDGGATWLESINTLCANFPDGTGFQEPGVVELKNGGVWTWMRTEWTGGDPRGPHQWEGFSGDDGMVWSAAQPSPDFISAVCSPASIKHIPQTGDLLAVWNDQMGHFDLPAPEPGSNGRTPLVYAVSMDEGQSWRNHHLLEDAPDHGYCYTAIHFTGDSVLFAYCAGDACTGGILNRLRIRRVPLSQLYRQ